MPFNYFILIFFLLLVVNILSGKSCTHVSILRPVLSIVPHIYSIRLQHITSEYLFFSLCTKPGVYHKSFPISGTGLNEAIPGISPHIQNGIITQRK